MPKVELSKVDVRTGSSYPAPFDEPCLSRRSERLSDAGGLTQFGVHRQKRHTTLKVICHCSHQSV